MGDERADGSGDGGLDYTSSSLFKAGINSLRILFTPSPTATCAAES